MTDTVLPEGTSGSALLKVQASSKLAFGATTAALVALASGGTAMLVSSGAGSMSSPTALPGGALLPGAADGTAASGSVVVDRAPGTYAARPPVDATVQALKEALAQRPTPGKRTLTVPLVDLGGIVTTPVVDVVEAVPEIVPPAVPATPPVGRPKPGKPVVNKPDTGKPVVSTPEQPSTPTAPVVGHVSSPGTKADDRADDRADRADRADRKADRKDERGDKAKGEAKGKNKSDGKGKHARGRHSR